MAETDVTTPARRECRLAFAVACLASADPRVWLRALPHRPDLATVVWLAPSTSALDELVGDRDIVRGEPGDVLAPGRITVLDGAGPWVVDAEGHLAHDTERAPGGDLDAFLTSLARVRGPRLIALRIGRGAGGQGLDAVRQANGLTLVDTDVDATEGDLVVTPARLGATLERLAGFAAAPTTSADPSIPSGYDELLARLGHELRNPLAAISNAVELQRMLALDNSRLERSRTIIARQAAHMGRLVDALVDLSRLGRGKLRLRKEPLDLAELAQRHGDQRHSDAERANLDLRIELATGNMQVLGDRTRLTRVIDNLIDNALKNTRGPGEVVVAIRRDAADVILSVRDTGRGITDDERELVFAPFKTLTSEGAARGGLGLGLPLVRGFARQHGGSVELRSAGRDQGTEVIVRLPAAVALDAAPSPPPEPAPTPTRGAVEDDGRTRILVVEDNADNRMLMRDMLRMAGHEVELACDGPEAIEATGRFRPQVVLCDIGLPDDMSGYDVARALRDEQPRSPRLVAVTGFGLQRDLDRAREAGFDAHLTKPIDLDRLIAVIDEQLALWRSS